MIRKYITYCVILILNVAVAAAQKNDGFSGYVDSTKITFYFNVSSAAIDLDYSTNNEMLNKLRRVQEKQGADSIYVPRVDVFAGVSPEGSDEANSMVRWKRLDNSIHLIERYFTLPRYNENYFNAKVTIPQIWQNLATEVRKSDIKNKDRVMQCILTGGDVPAKIKSIDKGATWEVISQKFFPQLRRCDVVIYFKKREKGKAYPDMVQLLPENKPERKEYVKKPKKDELQAEKPIAPPKRIPKKTTVTVYEPLFAVNTNLMYDAVLAPNVGIEFPTGDRLSFNVSYVFPWWVAKDDSWCYELQYWELEGKYWFGNDRRFEPKLTGHALGLIAGVGYYDLESHSKGYQGEICINAGVSYHYAKRFGKNRRWRVQVGAGLGVMRTNYSYYEGKFDNKYLVWQRDGRYTWIGPNKLDINIGYLIHRRVEKPSKLLNQNQNKEGGDDAIKE
ncbi:MAG: DUF3575 domain-containing protein [Bacteroidales bacterium]|nr:DUF3575 domain-containing protein [Candidatus Scybalocola fimicaballi]